MSFKNFSFLVFFAIIFSSCITDQESKESVKTIQDTVVVVERDTLRFRDTVLSTSPNDSSIFSGVWYSNYAGTFPGDGSPASMATAIAFSSGDIISVANFSANVKANSTTTKINGRIKTWDKTSASVTWTGGGTGDCTWIISMAGRDLLIQEFGEGFFYTDSAVRFYRQL